MPMEEGMRLRPFLSLVWVYYSISTYNVKCLKTLNKAWIFTNKKGLDSHSDLPSPGTG